MASTLALLCSALVVSSALAFSAVQYLGAAGASSAGVYTMRMTRVNITVPDDVAAQAKGAGLNVSRLATAALVEELDRRGKIAALDAYLSELEGDFGPIPAEDDAAAARWADQLLVAEPTNRRARARRRRSA